MSKAERSVRETSGKVYEPALDDVVLGATVVPLLEMVALAVGHVMPTPILRSSVIPGVGD